MTDHAPQPGPLYWDYRCLVCSEPVRDHASFWSRNRTAIRILFYTPLLVLGAYGAGIGLNLW